MQHALALTGGFDCGPLFEHGHLRRPPKARARGWDYYHQRHAQKTPGWADAATTQAIYEHARALTQDTGTLHEVDHIVPLNHPLVCGLHWHGNMQVLPHDVNRRKSNNFWPDMWGEQPDLLTVALTPTSSSLQQSIPR